MSLIPYENVVGILMYLMVCTRPDLAYAMSIVSRYMSYPWKRHWEVVMWILRYLEEAAKEAIWLGRFVTDMGLMQRSITLHCDSMSAIHLAVNQKMDGRLKHIDIIYHYLREVVEEKKIDFTKIDGKDNLVDALTKVIPLEVCVKHKEKLNSAIDLSSLWRCM